MTKASTEQALKKFFADEVKCDVLKMRIEEIAHQITGQRAIEYDNVKVTSSAKRTDDKTIELIYKKSMYEDRYKDLKSSIDMMQRAIDVLTEEEKTFVLYHYKHRMTITATAYRMSYSRSNVHRIKHRTLEKLDEVIKSM